MSWSDDRRVTQSSIHSLCLLLLWELNSNLLARFWWLLSYDNCSATRVKLSKHFLRGFRWFDNLIIWNITLEKLKIPNGNVSNAFIDIDWLPRESHVDDESKSECSNGVNIYLPSHTNVSSVSVSWKKINTLYTELTTFPKHSRMKHKFRYQKNQQKKKRTIIFVH